MNFGNEVTKIPFVRIQLPKLMKRLKEKCSKWKKKKKKTNCSNQVTEIQGEWGERKKGLWQPNCWKWMKKKKKKKVDVLLFNTLTLVDPCTTFVKKLTRSTIFTIVIIFLIIIIIIIIIIIYIYIYSNIAALVQYYSSKGKFKC